MGSSQWRKVRASVGAIKGHLTRANVQLIQAMESFMTHMSAKWRPSQPQLALLLGLVLVLVQVLSLVLGRQTGLILILILILLLLVMVLGLDLGVVLVLVLLLSLVLVLGLGLVLDLQCPRLHLHLHHLAHGQKSQTPNAIILLERVRESDGQKGHRLRSARSCARMTAKSSQWRKVRASVGAIKGHLTRANVQLIQAMESFMTHTSGPLT